ncbi:hypothetical protein [Larkinella soli]|uniref:hypothetical protein n=1 Tax=Larkinella soli TaxID=1770527 RepID=UPI0013E3A5C5|nr:hypothetical protein [Larkinella soli]
MTDPEGKPLAGVYVFTGSDARVGTVTNEEGVFRLSFPGPGDSLTFSLLGFQRLRLPATSPMEVILKPGVIQLAEVNVVLPKAVALVRKAIEAIPIRYEQKPGKSQAFYREIIRDQEADMALSEAVFEVFTFPGKKEKVLLKLVQGRSGRNVKATRLFEDFHPGGGPQEAIGFDIRLNPPTFLQNEFLDRYDYTLDSMTVLDERPVYVVRFDQREGVRKALQKGVMYLDSATAAVVRYEAGFSPRGLPYLRHLSGSDQLIAGLLRIDLVRKRLDVRADYRFREGIWEMTYAAFSFHFQYRQPKKDLDVQAVITSELVITGRSAGPVEPPVVADRWLPQNLAINLPTDYDETFWGALPVISPTTAIREVARELGGAVVGPSLRQDTVWKKLQAPFLQVMEQPSTLVLRPLVKSAWRDDRTGGMLYQNRTGDFGLEALVQVRKARDTTQAPDRGFQAGGLLIRVPDHDDAPDHLFFGLGTGGNQNLKLLIQNTIQGRSAVQPIRTESDNQWLRIERRGNEFRFLTRKEGAGDWTLVRSIRRDNWPETVQAGLAAYADFTGNGPKMYPDLQVKFSRTLLTP